MWKYFDLVTFVYYTFPFNNNNEKCLNGNLKKYFDVCKFLKTILHPFYEMTNVTFLNKFKNEWNAFIF